MWGADDFVFSTDLLEAFVDRVEGHQYLSHNLSAM